MGPTCGEQFASGPTTPWQLRALQPVYVGWVHVVPESNEKYTPEAPTPPVNGQVVSSPGLQASSSISSLEPATRMLGRLASTASAGSFCLFSENGVGGLPTDTSVSGLNAIAGIAASSATAAAIGMAESFVMCQTPTARHEWTRLPRSKHIPAGGVGRRKNGVLAYV